MCKALIMGEGIEHFSKIKYMRVTLFLLTLNRYIFMSSLSAHLIPMKFCWIINEKAGLLNTQASLCITIVPTQECTDCRIKLYYRSKTGMYEYPCHVIIWVYITVAIQKVARPSGTNLQLAAETCEFPSLSMVPWDINVP